MGRQLNSLVMHHILHMNDIKNKNLRNYYLCKIYAPPNQALKLTVASWVR
jgi:hypothetical protein